MPNNWRSYSIVLSIALAVALWFSIDGCNRKVQDAKDLETLMKIHFRDSSELAVKNNQLGQATVTAEAFELSKQALEKYVKQSDEMKGKLANVYSQINSLNTTIANFKIDSLKISVPKGETLPCADIDKSYPVLDKYYSFDFRFKNKSGHEPEFYFLNLNIPDTTTEVIGIKKSGFLNMKHELVSEQIHTNKYIHINGVKTIVKSEAKPKTLKKIAFGFISGIVATIIIEQKLKK